MTAKTTAEETDNPISEAWNIVTCRLVRFAPNGIDVLDVLDHSQAEVNEEAPIRAALALEGLTYVAADNTKLGLQCRDDGGFWSEPNTNLDHTKLLVQQVGGYFADGS